MNHNPCGGSTSPDKGGQYHRNIHREGFIVSKKEGVWIHSPIDPSGEVQVGYYHILANDMDEAIAIAEENPEFEFVPSATIEIKPIKTKEVETGFVYPTKK